MTPAEPPRAPAQRVEIVCSAATVAKGIALAFAVVLVVVAKDALLAIALAGVLVLGLDPVVIALEARGWGRGRAAVFVFALIGAVVLVIVVWAAKPLWNEIRQFAGDLPGYVNKIQQSAVFNDIDKQTDVFKKVHSAVTNLAKDIPDAAASLLGAAGQLVGAVFSLVTLVFLTLFGLVARPQITHSVSELMYPGSGERFERILEEVSRTISFALIGNVVISVIAGSVVGVTAAIVGAPTPAVLAVIVGLFDLIPQVGSAIAAVIVVGVTLVASGTGPAVILLVVILVYQQVENYLIQPAVMRQAVELSAFATIAVVMLGSALLGVVGAILAVPVAASVKVVLRELTMARRERMAALRRAQPQSP